jgi:cyclopropane-fatty-acyl-phospholipid synthase
MNTAAILRRLPEPALRWGMRRLLALRLWLEARRSIAIDAELSNGPIALLPDAATRPYSEPPAAFFEQVLGASMKYSGAYWPEGVVTLDEAETAMLELTGSRAQLADGQRVLELGCGWGSLSCWMARRFPNSRIVAVASSAPQRDFIEARKPANLEVVTADINTLTLDTRFDRVVSVELFERLHNWRELLQRITGWLEPGGKLFVHIFCHRRYAYPLETDGVGGELMPSLDLLPRFQGSLVLEKTWEVGGEHYARTAEAWARNLAAHESEVRRVFAAMYGAEAELWLQRWRIHFLACAELFGYRRGTEWLVGHYRLRKP